MKHFTYVHVRKQGHSQLCLIETQFIDEIPHLIFQDEQDPGITEQIALNPKRFHRHGGQNHSDAHIYEIAVDAPLFSHVLDPMFKLPNKQPSQQASTTKT